MPDAAVFLAAARGLDRIAGAGAVDQDAFLTMRLARLGEGRVDRSVVGDGAFTENAGDLGRDGDALFLLQVEDRDLDALGGERGRCRGAKARGAPGDDGGYGGVECHLVLPNSSPPRRRGPLAILLKADSGPRLRGGDAEFSKPLDDGDVGLAAAFAHRLEAILAAGGIEHAEQGRHQLRSEEHTSELQSLMRISYAVFCLKKTKNRSKELDKQ